MNRELVRFNIALLLSLYHKPVEFHLNMRYVHPCYNTISCSQAIINGIGKPGRLASQHYLATAANGWARSRQRVSQSRLAGGAPAPRARSPAGLPPPSHPDRGAKLPCRHQRGQAGPTINQSRPCSLAEVCPARAYKLQLQKQNPEMDRLAFTAEDETLCSLKTRSPAECFFSSQTALVDKYYHAQGPSTPIFHNFYFSQTTHLFLQWYMGMENISNKRW